LVDGGGEWLDPRSDCFGELSDRWQSAKEGGGGVGAQPWLWTSDGFGGVAPTVELKARARLRHGDGHVTLWGVTVRWSWGHGERSSVWRG
jgi:hypothetical protein